jgi:hypothetical protein
MAKNPQKLTAKKPPKKADILKGPIRKKGRPLLVLTKDQIQLLETLGGLLTRAEVADFFNMTPKTYAAIEARQEGVFSAYQHGKTSVILKVATALYEKALGGDVPAQKFYLTTQAGWSETSTLIVKDEIEEEYEEPQTIEEAERAYNEALARS